MSHLSDAARRHLWMHFTRLGALATADVPIITRGEGCYVWDEHGNRYLDGLSGLFTVQVGHGRRDPEIPAALVALHSAASQFVLKLVPSTARRALTHDRHGSPLPEAPVAACSRS